MNINIFIIAEMQPEDITAVKMLETRSGLSTWTTEDYLNEIKRNDSFIKTIYFKEKFAGFISARLITSGIDPTLNQAEIFNIAIEENFRKKNMGSFILKNLIKKCRELKIYEIWLEVRKLNKIAQNFYKKYGFTPINERKDYYTNPLENAVVMKLVLNKNTDENEIFKT